MIANPTSPRLAHNTEQGKGPPLEPNRFWSVNSQ